MSLVEQAAQRLEQLRKAGKQVAEDLTTPQPGAHTEPLLDAGSTIQRVAKELEKRPAPSPEPAVARRAEPAAGVQLPANADGGDPYAERERREPVLKPAAPAVPGPQLVRKAPLPPPAGSPRSKLVDIDLARLAARGVLTPDASHSRLANELRVIKRPLINNCLGKSAGRVKNANRIMITSALPGEGKSFLSTNLAMTMATERDSTVLLVEGDPTRPSLSRLLGLSPGQGLLDLLTDPSLDVADVLVKTNIGFSFISAGTRQAHVTELL
ncbi:MAG TPA: hypothetical protein VMG58_13165, partial [Candidatus Sulfotelmatobacter sp.]|nr:hypothetical protein [Candidatus Sulfotelmatobacter sp.]